MKARANKGNYFTFGTDEACQDAFLCWFLENWDDPRMGDAVKRFLISIAGLPIQEQTIRKISTKRQWHRIDVAATIELTSGDQCWLFVESKVHSILGMEKKEGKLTGRNRLEVYNDAIKQEQGRKRISDDVFVRRIYFKTGFASEWERKEVERVNWRFVERTTISDFFTFFEDLSYPKTLCEFAARIRTMGEVSKESMEHWTIENWLTWIAAELKPAASREFGQSLNVELHSYQGRFAGVYVWKERGDKPGSFVCLEIKFGAEESANDMDVYLRPLDDPDALFKPVAVWESPDIEMLRSRLQEYSPKYFSLVRKDNKTSFGRRTENISGSCSNEEMLRKVIETIKQFLDFANSLRA